MKRLDAWLAKTTEEPLEPDLPICDPHHHLWYNTETAYELDDFLDDVCKGHNVRQTVFVESRMMLREDGPPEMRPVGETEFVRRVTPPQPPSDEPDVAAGIVGFADLALGEAVAPVLEAHLAAGGGRFRGIRYTTAWDPYPSLRSRLAVPQGIMADAGFRAGFALLRRYNLSFDAWLFHPQLRELLDLALSFPDIPVIIDHVGGPVGIGPYAEMHETVFEDWKRDTAALASCPNIYVKLGGLGMRLGGFGWHDAARPPGSAEIAGAVAPYFQWCIERFGVDRCMFESNFPVDRISYSYTVLWNAFKLITRDFSYRERLALFHDTAVKVYRLAP